MQSSDNPIVTAALAVEARRLSREDALAQLRQRIADGEIDADTVNEAGNACGAMAVRQPAAAVLVGELCYLLRDAAQLSPDREMGVLTNLASAYASLGDHTNARTYATLALDRARAQGDAEAELSAGNALSMALDATGEHERAQAVVRDLLQRHRATMPPKLRAILLCNFGVMLRRRGKPAEALAAYREALPLAREQGDHVNESNLLGNMGNVLKELGHDEEALEHYRQGLAVGLAAGDLRAAANKARNLGNTYMEMGRPQDAIPQLEEAGRIASDAGIFAFAAVAYEEAADIAGQLRDRARAADCLSKAEGCAARAGDSARQAALLGRLCWERLVADDHRGVEEALSRAAALGIEPQDARTRAHLCVAELFLYMQRGETERAADMMPAVVANLAGFVDDRLLVEAAVTPRVYPVFHVAQQVLAGRLRLDDAIERVRTDPAIGSAELAAAREIFFAAKVSSHKLAYVLGRLTSHGFESDEAEIRFRRALAPSLQRAGDPGPSLESAQRGLEASRRIGDEEAESDFLGYLGVIFRRRGERDQAREALTRAIEIRERIGSTRGLGYVVGNLGNVLLDEGNTERAMECYERALTLHQGQQDRDGEAHAYLNLGEVELERDAAAAALAHFERALALLRETGRDAEEGNILTRMAICHLDLGHSEVAEKCFGEGLEAVRRANDKVSEIQALANWASLHVRSKQPGRAVILYRQAAELAVSVGQYPLAIRVLGTLASTLVERLGDVKGAIAALEGIATVAGKMGNPATEIGASLDVAALLQRDGKPAEAAGARQRAYRRLLAAHRSAGRGQSPPEAAQDVLDCVAGLELEGDAATAVRALVERTSAALGGPGGVLAVLNEIGSFAQSLGLEHVWGRGGDLVTSMLSGASENAPVSSPDLGRVIEGFVRTVLGVDLSTMMGRGAALRYLEAHPVLFSPEAEAFLSAEMGARPPSDPARIAIGACRGLIAQHRGKDISEVILREMGATGGNAASPEDGMFAMVSLDGESARLSVPEALEERASELLGLVFRSGQITVKNDDVLRIFDATGLDLMKAWAEQARAQGATAIVGRLASFEHVARSIRIGSAFARVLDAEQLRLYNLAQRLLGFSTRHDAAQFVRQQPEALSDGTVSVLATLERAAQNDEEREWVRRIRAIVDDLRSRRRELGLDVAAPDAADAGAAPGGRQQDNAARAVEILKAQCKTYALARAVASGELEFDAAAKQALASAETDSLLVGMVVPSLPAEEADLARLCIDLLDSGRSGLTAVSQLMLAYGAGLFALKRAPYQPRAVEMGKAALAAIGEADTSSMPGLDIAAAEMANNLSILLLRQVRPAEALEAAEEAHRRLLALGSADMAALGWTCLGHAAHATHQTQRAIDCLRKAMTLRESLEQWDLLSSVQRSMGDVLFEVGRRPEALPIFEKSLSAARKARSRADEASSLNKIGVALRELRMVDRARSSFEEALRIFEAERNVEGMGSVIGNLGNLERDAGRPSEAIALYERALSLDPHALDNRATWTGNIGAAFLEMQDVDRGVVFTERALEAHQKLGNTRMVGRWSLNLSSAEEGRDNLDKALAHAQTAREALEKVGDVAALAGILNQLASLAERTGRAGEAEPLRLTALAHARSAGDRRQEAFILDGIADGRAERGDWKGARDAWSEALTLARHTGPAAEASIMISLAGAHVELGDDSTAALDLARGAVERMEVIRRGIAWSGQRRTAFARFAPRYEKLLGLLVRLGAYTEAFELSERVRARSLTDMLADLDAPPAGVPAELRARYEDLVRAVRHATDASTEAASGAARARSEELAQTLEEIRKYDPSFVEAQEGRVVSIDEVRRVLPPRAVLMELCLLRDTAVVFLIPGDQVATFAEESAGVTPGSPPANGLDLWIRESGMWVMTIPTFSTRRLFELLTHAETGWIPAYNAHRRQGTEETLRQCQRALAHTLAVLHEEMFAPIVRRLGAWRTVAEIICVPHRALHLLPLHAVSWDEREPLGGTVVGKRRLGDDYSLVYAPSATVWARSARARKPRPPGALLIDDPTKDLRFSRHEVDSVARTLGEPCTVLRGEDARKADVLARMGSAGLIHLSCHGTFSGVAPLKSALHLSDGPLTAEDIFRDVRLARGTTVVMSACETGIVDLSSPADEYVGLSSAFLYSGAETVVSSLWAVNDFSTALLMDHMYSRMKAGSGTRRALREAQRWLRTLTSGELMAYAESAMRAPGAIPAAERLTPLGAAEAILQHWDRSPSARPFEDPYYWAGFIAVGEAG